MIERGILGDEPSNILTTKKRKSPDVKVSDLQGAISTEKVDGKDVAFIRDVLTPVFFVKGVSNYILDVDATGNITKSQFYGRSQIYIDSLVSLGTLDVNNHISYQVNLEFNEGFYPNLTHFYGTIESVNDSINSTVLGYNLSINSTETALVEASKKFINISVANNQVATPFKLILKIYPISDFSLLKIADVAGIASITELSRSQIGNIYPVTDQISIDSDFTGTENSINGTYNQHLRYFPNTYNWFSRKNDIVGSDTPHLTSSIMAIQGATLINEIKFIATDEIPLALNLYFTQNHLQFLIGSDNSVTLSSKDDNFLFSKRDVFPFISIENNESSSEIRILQDFVNSEDRSLKFIIIGDVTLIKELGFKILDEDPNATNFLSTDSVNLISSGLFDFAMIKSIVELTPPILEQRSTKLFGSDSSTIELVEILPTVTFVTDEFLYFKFKLTTTAGLLENDKICIVPEESETLNGVDYFKLISGKYNDVLHPVIFNVNNLKEGFATFQLKNQTSTFRYTLLILRKVSIDANADLNALTSDNFISNNNVNFDYIVNTQGVISQRHNTQFNTSNNNDSSVVMYDNLLDSNAITSLGNKIGEGFNYTDNIFTSEFLGDFTSKHLGLFFNKNSISSGFIEIKNSSPEINMTLNEGAFNVTYINSGSGDFDKVLRVKHNTDIEFFNDNNIFAYMKSKETNVRFNLVQNKAKSEGTGTIDFFILNATDGAGDFLPSNITEYSFQFIPYVETNLEELNLVNISPVKMLIVANNVVDPVITFEFSENAGISATEISKSLYLSSVVGNDQGLYEIIIQIDGFVFTLGENANYQMFTVSNFNGSSFVPNTSLPVINSNTQSQFTYLFQNITHEIDLIFFKIKTVAETTPEDVILELVDGLVCFNGTDKIQIGNVSMAGDNTSWSAGERNGILIGQDTITNSLNIIDIKQTSPLFEETGKGYSFTENSYVLFDRKDGSGNPTLEQSGLNHLVLDKTKLVNLGIAQFWQNKTMIGSKGTVSAGTLVISPSFHSVLNFNLTLNIASPIVRSFANSGVSEIERFDVATDLTGEVEYSTVIRNDSVNVSGYLTVGINIQDALLGNALDVIDQSEFKLIYTKSGNGLATDINLSIENLNNDSVTTLFFDNNNGNHKAYVFNAGDTNLVGPNDFDTCEVVSLRIDISGLNFILENPNNWYIQCLAIKTEIATVVQPFGAISGSMLGEVNHIQSLTTVFANNNTITLSIPNYSGEYTISYHLFTSEKDHGQIVKDSFLNVVGYNKETDNRTVLGNCIQGTGIVIAESILKTFNIPSESGTFLANIVGNVSEGSKDTYTVDIN